MLLVASSLALLVIYAGVKLLIQTKRETLGNLFRWAAWFFIIAGFLMLACTGAYCIAICCKYGAKMTYKKHEMMGGYDDGMSGHYKHHKKMMKCHHGEYEKDCNINCCGQANEKCCDYRDVCKRDTMKCSRK